MDYPDDLPSIDPRRLSRWRAGPCSHAPHCRDPLVTPRDAIASHGGEVPFWLAWLRGELDADLQGWVRQRAEQDPELRNDLRSIEQPHSSGYSTRAARAEVRNALEAGNYLVEAPPPTAGLPGAFALCDFEEQTETDLVLSRTGTAIGRKGHPQDEANAAELRRRIRTGLFALLEEVEITVPPAEEVREGTQLLEHLVGLSAVSRFLQLQQLQARATGSHPSLHDRLLRVLVPELFAKEGERFRYRLSFRLFLRSRLQHCCRNRGWLPAGPRFRDLPSAFAALSRERIGALVRGMLAARDVFQAAGIPCQHLTVLLETAP